MILRHKLALALTLALTAAAAKADPIVYILGDSGQFGTVNLSTGSFTPIGPGHPGRDRRIGARVRAAPCSPSASTEI